MAEHQTSVPGSAETTQRFIEFVLFQTQNASMFLGRIPNPQTGQGEVNLDIARMLIDQLEMIAEKTRGNLNSDESHVLTNALTNLRIAFVEASGGIASSPGPKSSGSVAAASTSSSSIPESPSDAAAGESAPDDADDAGSRKKFSKSYGS
jgi:hypothetical protein